MTGDLWRSHTSGRSFKPLIALVEVVSALSLAALAIAAASPSPGPTPLEENYPFVLGLQHGWCSTAFLEPVWGDRTANATAVCDCESRGRPTAISRGVPYYGLFQVDPLVHGLDRDLLLNPVYNSFIAATLQDRDGWEPWPVCAEDLIRD